MKKHENLTKKRIIQTIIFFAILLLASTKINAQDRLGFVGGSVGIDADGCFAPGMEVAYIGEGNKSGWGLRINYIPEASEELKKTLADFFILGNVANNLYLRICMGAEAHETENSIKDVFVYFGMGPHFRIGDYAYVSLNANLRIEDNGFAPSMASISFGYVFE